jgi:hypothetical protein
MGKHSSLACLGERPSDEDGSASRVGQDDLARQGAMMFDVSIPQYPVSELRLVRLYMKNRPNSYEYFMHQSQVEVFVKASLELHFEPGINPYNKVKTSEIWFITVSELQGSNAWWWTTIGLGIDKANQGASISYWKESRVWTHPELAALELEEHKQDMRDEAAG